MVHEFFGVNVWELASVIKTVRQPRILEEFYYYCHARHRISRKKMFAEAAAEAVDLRLANFVSLHIEEDNSQ